MRPPVTAFIFIQVIVLILAVYSALNPASALQGILRLGISLGRRHDRFDHSDLERMEQLHSENSAAFLVQYRNAIRMIRLYGIGFMLMSVAMIWFVLS